MSRVTVYGADWCEDTRQTRKYLESRGVDYDYINIEKDREASAWVKQQNDGKERKPTVKVGERVLKVPADQELETALREQGLLD